jgi:hypothetical protein
MEKTGWVLSWIFALFMLVASAAPKFLGAQVAVDPMTSLGWPVQFLVPIGLLEVAGTILFLLPRTAVCGALLLTGVFGGAIASHLRVGSPMVSATLFGVYLGLTMWAALWLRAENLRAVLPFTRIPSRRVE